MLNRPTDGIKVPVNFAQRLLVNMPHLCPNNPHYSFFESLKEKHYDTLASFVPSFESEFNVKKKIFRSIIYSKLGTEITKDDRPFNFILVVANNIKHSNEFGLNFGLALVQLIDNIDKKLVGTWLNNDDDDDYFQNRLVDCSRLLVTRLLKLKNLAESDDVVHLPEFLCLLILSFYEPCYARAMTDDEALNDVDVITHPHKHPLERVFVPNFKSHVEWQDASSYFRNPPECLKKYDNVKVGQYYSNVADHDDPILLIQLNSDDMKKEWITSAYINNNVELLLKDINNKWLNKFPFEKLIRINLVNYQNTMCAMLIGCMEGLTDLEDDDVSEYGYLFYPVVATTMALYIKMFGKINSALKMPLIESNNKFLCIYNKYPPQMLIYSSMPIIEKKEIGNDNSIQYMIDTFLLKKKWFNNKNPTKNPVDLTPLWPILINNNNNNAYVEAGAKFFSKFFKRLGSR